MNSQETIHELLDRLGIRYEEYHHQGDGSHFGEDHHDDHDDDDHDNDHHDDDHDDHDDHIPGLHPKCLFLENRDGHKHYLVIAPSPKRIDMTKLAQQLGARRLSFGSSKPLKEWLHATPGTLSPFGLTYDMQKNVSVVLDEELLKAERVGFHSEGDTSTLVISAKDLLVFLNATARSVATLPL